MSRPQLDDPDKRRSGADGGATEGHVVGEDDSTLIGSAFENIGIRPTNRLFVPGRAQIAAAYAKARDDVRAERDRALREIETATQQALKELAEKSTDLAIELAGKIVRAELKPADHTRLIADAVAGFATANPSKN